MNMEEIKVRGGVFGSEYGLLLLRTFKVKASLKLLCPGCRFVNRKGKLRVICSKNPRHKQRQG